MILFVCESNRRSATGFRHFFRMVQQRGEPCGYDEAPPEPKPSRLAVKHCPHDPADMAAFQKFKHGRTPEKQNTGNLEKYGQSEPAIEAAALDWYGHYWRTFEEQYYRNGLEHIVTWGSGIAGNRAAILAAEDMGFAVSVLEDGWFIYPDEWFGDHSQAGRSFILSPHRAYYEYDEWPQMWLESYADYQYAPERFEDYRAMWLDAQVTKYTGTPRQKMLIADDSELPRAWLNGSSHTVWIGQVHGDASQFYSCTPADRERIREAAVEAEAWYKPHPFADALGDPDWDRILPREANIHAILPDCERIMTLTSNVGLEAEMFAKPADIYGHPVYAQEPVEDRQRFITWAIDELQFHQLDAEKLVHKLHKQREWQQDAGS